jgi:hypothetical protein
MTDVLTGFADVVGGTFSSSGDSVASAGRTSWGGALPSMPSPPPLALSPCDHKGDVTVCWICTEAAVVQSPLQTTVGPREDITAYFLRGRWIHEDEAHRITRRAAGQRALTSVGAAVRRS